MKSRAAKERVPRRERKRRSRNAKEKKRRGDGRRKKEGIEVSPPLQRKAEKTEAAAQTTSGTE